MSHVVFPLHGMGAQTDGWHKEFVDSISAAYDQYDFMSRKSLADRGIEFQPVNYDNIFREIVSTWADNAEIVSKVAGDTGAPIGKLTDWLKGAGELNDNFKWSHAADVLLYRGFSLVRARVCVHVARQITGRIKKQIDDEGSSNWSLIAHSLGTAVAHDTLARLWKKDSTLPGDVAFSADNEQANLIMMVANVSRVLEVKTAAEPYDVFLSPVKPGRPGQEGRGCQYYFTPRHKLDPFTVPSMFNPQMWPDEAALQAQPPRYLYREIDHIHKWNVHEFSHYMANPRVHIPMFQRLFGTQVIEPQEEQLALAKFRQFGKLEDDVAIRIRQKLEDAQESQSETWTILGRIWRNFIGKGSGGRIP